MKKKVSLLLTVVMVLSILPVFGAAKVSAAEWECAFVDTFFPGGKVEAPSNLYAWFPYETKDGYGELFVWADQPDDILNYSKVRNEYYNTDMGFENLDEYFNRTYGVSDHWYTLQLDVSVDGSEWMYDAENPVDKDYWDTAGVFETEIVPGVTYKTRLYSIGNGQLQNLCPNYVADEIMYGDIGEGAAYDTANHTYEFRARYVVGYQPAGMTDYYYIQSDWSDTITFGKDAVQKEIECPKELVAPDFSFFKKDLNGKKKWTGGLWYKPAVSREVSAYEKYLLQDFGDDRYDYMAWEKLSCVFEAAINDPSESEFIEVGDVNTELVSSVALLGANGFEGLKPNAKARILLRAYNQANYCDEEGYSAPLKSEYTYMIPQVTGLKATAQDTQSITLAWNAVDQAESYEIYNSKNKLVGTTDATTFKAEGLEAGTGYDFKVRAVVETNYVGLFSKVLKTPTAPETPVFTGVTSKKKAYIQPSWEKVDAGTGYQVQTATNAKFTAGKKSNKIKKLATLTKSLKRTSGKKLYVRVRSYVTYGGTTVYSDWSNSKSVKVK